jgi:hypothetical protein
VTLTTEQVEIGTAISQVVMSWVAFIATLIATAAFLGFLVWCVLKHEDIAAKIVVGVIDSFLLNLLRIIFKHVFYDRSPKALQPTK